MIAKKLLKICVAVLTSDLMANNMAWELTIAGGAVVLLYALYIWYAFSAVSAAASALGAYGSLYGGAVAGAVAATYAYAFLPGISLGSISLYIGILAGIVLIIAGFMMRTPAKAKTWSMIAIVFAIVSLFGGAGYYLGFLLAIAGGALAFMNKG